MRKKGVDGEAVVAEFGRKIAKQIIMLGLLAALSIGALGTLSSAYYIKNYASVTEKRDLNNDGIEDTRVQIKGKTPEYYLSNKQGTFDHGKLAIDGRMKYIKMDNCTLYFFGESGLEKVANLK